jgi:flagellar basal body rod protein FlgB
MYNSSGPMGALKQYMNYLEKGLAVHTDNLNRADMPGESANELKPFSEHVHTSSGSRLAMTDSLHMSSHGGSSNEYALKQTNSTSDTLSGNSIDREREVSKVNDITTEYLKAVRLSQKCKSFMLMFLNLRG